MYCLQCGNAMAPEDRVCSKCGKEVFAGAAMPAAAPFAGVPQTSGKAIGSLVCGLFFFTCLASIVAIVLGHMSLSEIRKSAGRLKGEGLAIGGLVLGYMGIVAIPFILIVAAIAIPNLLRARMAANESSAAAGVRTLITAEFSYSEKNPAKGYTCSLSDLSEAQLIDSTLANSQMHGYTFELQGCTAETQDGPNTKFRVVAYPVKVNNTGMKAFCSDESAVIKIDAGGSPQRCLESGENLQ